MSFDGLCVCFAVVEKRYPETRFEFVNAGIPSMGTVAHAHRFSRDVIADRAPDRRFVEAAVNDLHNGKSSGLGLWLNAGPDSAILRWRVDGGTWSDEIDTHTRWSQGLHLPHTFLLAEKLPRGRHRIDVEVVERRRGRGGEVLRVVHFLVHG